MMMGFEHPRYPGMSAPIDGRMDKMMVNHSMAISSS
jgi:hypothetical protein